MLLRPYSVFDIGRHLPYLDEARCRDAVRLALRRSYLPVNELLLRLIDRTAGRFRVVLSLNGGLLELLEKEAPEGLLSFRRLVDTGAVEVVGEPYYHSLSFQFSRAEFGRQIDLHAAALQRLLGVAAATFRPADLVYANPLAFFLQQRGYRAIFIEGTGAILQGRDVHGIYHPVHMPGTLLIPRDRLQSDTMAFRSGPLALPDPAAAAHAFAASLSDMHVGTIALSLDYETLGLHHPVETGIFAAMEQWPQTWLDWGHDFVCARDLAQPTHGPLDVQHFVGLGDEDQAPSLRQGNALQQEALSRLYSLESYVADSPGHLRDWSLLQQADLVAAMADKDAGARRRLGIGTPEDAYLNFMHLLSDFQLGLSVQV
ncbi:MAG: hypothetical protein OHK0039_08930 [Bacteroidia bacterium]